MTAADEGATFEEEIEALMAKRAGMTEEERRAELAKAMAFLRARARKADELAGQLEPGVYEIAPGYYFIKKDPDDHWSISG